MESKDASQTLYEFRAANPKALNALEASGIFDIHQLSINYRSNQEILDFANIVLNEVEANKYAKLQMQSNSMKPVTAKSFQKAVQLTYSHGKNQKEIKEKLPQLMNLYIKDWVQERLDAGEKICFLAYSRQQVNQMSLYLESAFGIKPASLVSARPFATEIFSRFIREDWELVENLPAGSVPGAIHKEIANNLGRYTRINDKNESMVRSKVGQFLSDWWVENNTHVLTWVNEVNQNTLTLKDYHERLIDNMLEYESAVNQKAMNMTRLANQRRKESDETKNAQLLVSTIHGAKGLEFDHVVVLHQDSTSEERKRMFYVAFTRPMKSLYILSTGTTKGSRIVTQYNNLVAYLEQQDAQKVNAGTLPVDPTGTTQVTPATAPDPGSDTQATPVDTAGLNQDTPGPSMDLSVPVEDASDPDDQLPAGVTLNDTEPLSAPIVVNPDLSQLLASLTGQAPQADEQEDDD